MPRFRLSQERQARAWRVALPAAVLLITVAAGFAAYDIYDEARRPGMSTVPGASSEPTADPRIQVLITITVSADAPFRYGYTDAEGDQVERTSPDGQEVTFEVARRGEGPYLRVAAQVAATGTFVQCRIDVDGDERSEERVEGGLAIVFCAA